jgi:hypothetical protein
MGWHDSWSMKRFHHRDLRAANGIRQWKLAGTAVFDENRQDPLQTLASAEIAGIDLPTSVLSQ